MFENNNSKATRSEDEVLLAKDLRKFYGPREALKGLSFSLKAGRILGFLGPNGAGKTTAIRILTTILEPDAGQFFVAGISSQHPVELRRKIGVLPESLGFHKQMTGLECLVFFGRLYGRSAAQAKENGLSLLKNVGLEQRGKSLVGSYSRGMRQRLGIARTLVNDPAVVFFDEPTLGLDPRGQKELLDLVRKIAEERNVGVVLCSHDLPEVESVCDDVVILSSGQIVASGTVADVIGHGQSRKTETTQKSSLRIQVPVEVVVQARKVLEALPSVAKVNSSSDMGGWLRVEFVDSSDGSLAKNKMLEALIRADISVLSFEAEGSRLQDVFLKLTDK